MPSTIVLGERVGIVNVIAVPHRMVMIAISRA